MEKTSDILMGDTPIDALRETVEESIERMMTQHGDSLMRLCYMMLSDRALAEDAVQETFFRAFKAYHRFRGDSSEYTWLTRIAVNCCRSQRAKNWFRREERRADLADMPGMQVDALLPDDTVLRAVMALRPKYKDPILLHYYQAMPVKDIAALLGIAVSTVSVRLMRARAMLKDELEEWYFDE